ncbi:MAG TPA: D-aminoacylase [Candidatus Didemnitutus sp.]|nr:D-aminoacylase [Candidatus Didemnitutus sp.]
MAASLLRLVLLLPLLTLLARAQEFDLVIRHARLIDGTGAPAVAGDLAIRGEQIAAVGKFPGKGRTEIDAAGRVVAPGFIDVHTHSEDITELPLAENFLRMGVTTIITGNCGFSKVDIAEFFRDIETTKVAINIGTLIGQGAVHLQVIGGGFARPPTAAELDQMRALVDRAMQDGAVGLSTGLIYIPGAFTKTEELVALAKVAAARGGIYTSHMRHENAQIVEALEEVATVAREAHIPAEVSHIKLSSPAAWGRAQEIVAWLDRARASGLAITEDQYVYTAASTSIGSLIDSEFREGGNEKFRERLADPEMKARMITKMKDSIVQGQRGDYAYAVIANFDADPTLNGKNIREAAKILRGSDTLDDQIETILDIHARGGALGVFHGMNEDDLQVFLRQPLTMIASDGGLERFGQGVPHPRGYGNNARVLGRYVRELKLLTLEDAVRKMTTLPAQTFHLGNRGILKAGAVADVVIFDPATVGSTSTFTDPHHYAVGFSDVIVNGTPVIRDGALTGARPGKPVRLVPASSN